MEQQFIRNNYDNKAREALSINERKQLDTRDLFYFNNWIKSVLIDNYAKNIKHLLKTQLDLKFSKNIINILDIGCGKGGDINKWNYQEINHYVGVDIAQAALKQLSERHKNMKNKKKFGLTLVKFDIGKDPSQFYSIDKLKQAKFDIITSQFVIHYLFKSQKSAENLIKNMSHNLLLEGVVLLTFPDCYSIIKKVKTWGVKVDDFLVYDNGFMSIKFNETKLMQNKGPYGLEYLVYMKNAIGERQNDEITYIPEWFIDLENFQKLLKDNDLLIIQNLNFLEFYKKYKDNYKKLFINMNLCMDAGETMNEKFWEIIHCYRVVVAKKISGQFMKQYNRKKRQQIFQKLPFKINF